MARASRAKPVEFARSDLYGRIGVDKSKIPKIPTKKELGLLGGNRGRSGRHISIWHLKINKRALLEGGFVAQFGGSAAEIIAQRIMK